uniref:Sperm-associated antigen 16 protein n=1 Tax=Erpetoichthys calabaricus TaxID=27687 RepID=A0A8C4RY70_ERPCA
SCTCTYLVRETGEAIMEEGAFYLERVSVSEYNEDDYQYEEVQPDEDWSLGDASEDLESAMKAVIGQLEETEATPRRPASTKEAQTKHPEIVDDFLRNFLIKMGMHKTFDCFQTEWYEMMYRGILNLEQMAFVPDVYVQNQLLDNELKSLRKQIESYKQAAFKAAEIVVKLQKERDFHRMQYRRVVQEKNRLIGDIKRVKKHYASYEPALKQLNDKYKTALKQKMLTSLERDRAVAEVTGLQATLRNVKPEYDMPPSSSSSQELRETQDDRKQDSEALEPRQPSKYVRSRHPNDSEFPVDTRVNPYLSQIKATASHKSGYRLASTLNVHELPVSSLALHPRKQVIVTTGDDHLWKMWSLPSGDIMMTGEGHSDWLSSCCFHPGGGKLATGSGDTTVKIWDFAKGECVLTFEGHSHAVWGCAWHSCGDFLASCSMDNTGKIWDLNSERCRYTLRGHADAVNSIVFLPFSNTLLTSSADKTLSLWDARTGLCAQTFYGHLHSCNDANFNMMGDTIVSCDSYGTVKLWDVRRMTAMLTIDAGPHPSNQVTFDPLGRLVAIASNDGSVKLLDLSSGKLSDLVGHEDAVQCVCFDHKGEYLISGGSDGTLRLWS